MAVLLGDGPTGQTNTEKYGTYGYLAPEQRNGEPRTFKGDIFAFGCVCLQVRNLSSNCYYHQPHVRRIRFSQMKSRQY